MILLSAACSSTCAHQPITRLTLNVGVNIDRGSPRRVAGMFRWKRGLLHALIPFGLAVAGGLVLLLVAQPADPEKLGEGVGRFGAVCFVLGLGIKSSIGAA